MSWGPPPKYPRWVECVGGPHNKKIMKVEGTRLTFYGYENAAYHYFQPTGSPIIAVWVTYK